MTKRSLLEDGYGVNRKYEIEYLVVPNIIPGSNGLFASSKITSGASGAAKNGYVSYNYGYNPNLEVDSIQILRNIKRMLLWAIYPGV
ncbi:MAG: hypothetical protein E7233_01975 [Lachnospiraceae bacterium]|nr:hypothetical protein [Lachnospiraceae bacterium]